MSGYNGLVWVNDKEGKEYVCSLDNREETVGRYEDLSDIEQKSCQNVNEIVGTERW